MVYIYINTLEVRHTVQNGSLEVGEVKAGFPCRSERKTYRRVSGLIGPGSVGGRILIKVAQEIKTLGKSSVMLCWPGRVTEQRFPLE